MFWLRWNLTCVVEQCVNYWSNKDLKLWCCQNWLQKELFWNLSVTSCQLLTRTCYLYWNISSVGINSVLYLTFFPVIVTSVTMAMHGNVWFRLISHDILMRNHYFITNRRKSPFIMWNHQYLSTENSWFNRALYDI